MRRSTKAIASLVAAGMLIAACGGDDDDTAADGAASPTTAAPAGDSVGSDGEGCTEERRGGVIQFAGISLPRGLDPSTFIGGGTVGGIELAAIYDVLMRYDPETGEYSPHVAESLTPNEDFTEWTLVLRPDVTFGNGDPLTASSVQAHTERLLAATGTNWATQLSKFVASTEVVDDLTVVFTLKEQLPYFAHFLADVPGMIVNTAIADERGDEFALNPAGAGVGPYEIERYSPGDELVVVPKDDYWGGPVCPDAVHFRSLPDPQANYEAFRNGDINFGLVTRGNVQADIKDAGENILVYPTSVGQALALNVGVAGSTPPTADVRVRKAMQHALDLDLINERVNEGFGEPTSAIISEDSMYSAGLEGLSYDPEMAAALVDEVKAETGWDGSISLLCTQQNQELAVVLQGLLDAVGFQTNVELVETSDFISRTYTFSGNFEASCSGLALTDAEVPAGGLQGFRSDPPNYAGYADDDMDAALKDLSQAASEEEVEAALATVQEVWNETMPLVVLSAGESDLYWGQDVRGLVPHQKIIALLHDAYVEQ